MSESEESALKFPCLFPVKAMGQNQPAFPTLVLEIVRRHCAEVPEHAMRSASSRNGKYLSVTVTVQAHSQAQLDSIYQELTACEQVLMAL